MDMFRIFSKKDIINLYKNKKYFCSLAVNNLFGDCNLNSLPVSNKNLEVSFLGFLKKNLLKK